MLCTFQHQQPIRMQCPGLASFAVTYWLWQNGFPTSFSTLEHSMLPGLAWMCLGTHVSPSRLAGTEEWQGPFLLFR